MSSHTIFKRGTFVKLRANSVIHLGRLERNIYEGDVVEYDGFSLKFGGQVTEMPELKAGVKRGWLSIVSENTEPEPEPPKPEIKTKKMAVENVYDEERPVTRLKEPEKKKESKFPVVIENQDEDIITVAKVDNKSGAEVAGSMNDGISEMQEAESLSTIKLSTSSRQKTVISDGSQASAEISKLENLEAHVTHIKTASVDIEDDISLEDAPPPAPEKDSEIDEQALENAQILQAIEGEVNPTQGAVPVGKDNSKIKVLPNGIEWDTSKHWSKRAKIAIDMYGDQPDVLESIISVETKGVKAAIEKELGNS